MESTTSTISSEEYGFPAEWFEVVEILEQLCVKMRFGAPNGAPNSFVSFYLILYLKGCKGIAVDVLSCQISIRMIEHSLQKFDDQRALQIIMIFLIVIIAKTAVAGGISF